MTEPNGGEGGNLEFDTDAASIMSDFYHSPDIVRRRNTALAALDARPGERIVDLGCGPGFYVAELSRQVGPDGIVIAVDPSETMLDETRRRCANAANVEVRSGSATDIVLADNSVDAVISVQVLEYVENVAAALTVMRNAVKPGGRIVVWDVDWETVSWFSADPVRMRRILTAWDDHLAHPALPQWLGGALREAGFVDVAMRAHPYVHAGFGLEGYGSGILRFIAGYVVGRRGITQPDVDAWMDEQVDLAGTGRYYFACTQFCFTAVKPG